MYCEEAAGGEREREKNRNPEKNFEVCHEETGAVPGEEMRRAWKSE